MSDDEDSVECEFKPVVTENEAEPHKKWYHKLLKLRCEGPRTNVFPPFPPPPLPSTMLAASRAQLVNPFEEVKRAASVSSAVNSPTSTSPNSINRFCPADFRALPPPHVFLEMIRTLAPHQYVDLTYALAGAVLLEVGAKVPDHFPLLPPKIDPFREFNEDISRHETEVSSQSSSGGEYSDESEETRLSLRLKREKNHRRRAERKIRIVARQNFLQKYKEMQPEREEEQHETFPRDQNYKIKTLSKFIPFHYPYGYRPPPLMPPFLPFPPVLPPFHDPANFQEYHPNLALSNRVAFFRIPPMLLPIGMFPFPVPPPSIPTAQPISTAPTPTTSKPRLKQDSPIKKTMLSKNELAMNFSLKRWRQRID